MQALKSERTSVTPEVVFSPAEQLLRIEGECYPENPLPFFNPILSMLGRYFEASQPPRFVAEMKLGEGGPKEDPREKLRRLREEMAAKARNAPPPGAD